MVNTYKPRNDFCIVKIESVNSAKGLILPDISREGKKLIVISVGPKVEGLHEGDSVLMSPNVDTYPLPNEKGLFAVRQDCISVVIEEE